MLLLFIIFIIGVLTGGTAITGLAFLIDEKNKKR